MAPGLRPSSPSRTRAFPRALRSAPLVSAAVLGSLLVASVVVGPPVLGSGRGSTASPSWGAQVNEQRIRTVAVTRVELDRRRGRVTGDGRTVYVANRTAFRPRRAKVEIPPRVRADAWAVVDLDTGRLLGSNQHGARLPQASTIKLLTALTAIRSVPRSTRHRVTRFEAGQVCSCVGLRPGARYRRDALLTGMLLASGNDAAEAIAGSHPRGRRAFYRAMNRLAQRLGAVDTVAKNASGLTAAGSHSSARDLVLLLRAALRDPTVAAILAMRSAEISTVGGRHRRTVWRSNDYVNRYPGSLGKSGWTTPAQNTLTVVTEIDGHRIAVASLGAPSGYSTDGARALTVWAAENLAGLRALSTLPGS